MDAHIRFDFKALCQNRIGLHKTIGKCPVAGHDIQNIAAEQAVDGSSDQAVSEVVKGTFVFGEIGT